MATNNDKNERNDRQTMSKLESRNTARLELSARPRIEHTVKSNNNTITPGDQQVTVPSGSLQSLNCIIIDDPTAFSNCTWFGQKQWARNHHNTVTTNVWLLCYRYGKDDGPQKSLFPAGRPKNNVQAARRDRVATGSSRPDKKKQKC